MDDRENQALLPAGLHDVLPPEAAHEVALQHALVASFARHGYERVSPPLIEFESTLIGAGGPGMGRHVFRVLDPTGRRMMAVRADMTPQVARIAATRLGRMARPLRLSYGGQVLTVEGSQMRPERQFAQAGAELIGVDCVAADVEILVLAVEALAAVGIDTATIDLNSPSLVTAILDRTGAGPEDAAELRAALDRKDSAAVAQLAGDDADLLLALIEAAGPVDDAIAKLEALDLPDRAVQEVARLASVAAGARTHRADLDLTVDPVEYRGFEYQTGISFTIFLKGVRGELGRGGRYVTEAGEAATGLTIFLDTVCRAVPPPSNAKRKVYLSFGTPPETAVELRGAGWTTVAGLAPVANEATEATSLGCTHLVEPGATEPQEI